jgi:hypothetical protein
MWCLRVWGQAAGPSPCFLSAARASTVGQIKPVLIACIHSAELTQALLVSCTALEIVQLTATQRGDRCTAINWTHHEDVLLLETQVLIAVCTKITALYVVLLSRAKGGGGVCCFHLQGRCMLLWNVGILHPAHSSPLGYYTAQSIVRQVVMLLAYVCKIEVMHPPHCVLWV